MRVKARKYTHLLHSPRFGAERLQIKSLGDLIKINFRLLFELFNYKIGTVRMASAFEVVRVAHVAV